jgi:hypothetical protein
VLPAEVQHLAQLHRVRQQQLARLATREAEQIWAQLGSNLAAWPKLLPQLVTMLTQAQLAAATGAQEYVGAAVNLQGATPAPAGRLNPRAFAGVASDGRDLTSLVDFPMFEVEAFTSGGMPVADALGVGLRHLGRIVATQVQDAARVATGVGIVNDRRAAGYLRVVTPPSCSRCTILAGKWYAYNAGFTRHPQCDCTSAPGTDELPPPSPRALYGQMSPDERRKAGWSLADQRAIDDGGDLSQVVNARKDLRSVSIAGQQLQATGHGATRRGLAGQRLGGRSKSKALRLTPESIYSESERLGWSRDETIRVLTLHGYIL